MYRGILAPMNKWEYIPQSNVQFTGCFGCASGNAVLIRSTEDLVSIYMRTDRAGLLGLGA